MTSSLKLNRLSVHRGKSVFYDENFHAGVNIIHGANGSGKSTIADFIYFALGGDLREWREEAYLAEYVLAEITAGEAVLTLRRDVSSDAMRPMSIYFGSYEEALSAGLTSWEKFPYKRPDGTGLSFSQVLFKAIGIPEAISDGVSNITMHQLLRVLYADQLTPIQRIFRVESFDTWQTRQAVGDMLCGIGGYDLYALQLFLRDLKKEYDATVLRWRSLVSIASSYGDKILGEHIQVAKDEAISRRNLLLRQIDELLASATDAAKSAESDQLEKIQRKEYLNDRANVEDIRKRIETLKFEIEDGEQFIEHLKESLRDFDDAGASFFALGALRFEFCPSCFTPMAHAPSTDGTCSLCGSKVSKEEDQSRVLAVKLDFEMQVNESLALQSARKEELTRLNSELRIATNKLNSRILNLAHRTRTMTRFDELLSEANRKIGYLDSEIEQLERRMALADEIATLSAQKEALNSRIETLNGQIEATETAQQHRKRVAYTEISSGAKALLEQDLQEHSDFGDIETVNFSFANDWFAINNNQNRVGSASGMVVLKNSFLLSLFRASLKDKKFNLPRFIIMDNIEDKGMVEERSWNFQRLIIKVSDQSETPHQIIFSTSKIAPELANSDYVVGTKYSRTRHTLNISPS